MTWHKHVTEHTHCAQLPHKQNTCTIERNVRGNCAAPVGLKDVMNTVISGVNRMWHRAGQLKKTHWSSVSDILRGITLQTGPLPSVYNINVYTLGNRWRLRKDTWRPGNMLISYPVWELYRCPTSLIVSKAPSSDFFNSFNSNVTSSLYLFHV